MNVLGKFSLVAATFFALGGIAMARSEGDNFGKVVEHAFPPGQPISGPKAAYASGILRPKP